MNIKDYKLSLFKQVYYYAGPNNIMMKVLNHDNKWGFADKKGNIIAKYEVFDYDKIELLKKDI